MTGEEMADGDVWNFFWIHDKPHIYNIAHKKKLLHLLLTNLNSTWNH